MKLDVAEAGELEVSELVFGSNFNNALVHQVVVAFLSAARQGTHSQKTRSEVRGGGRKPWRQKGSGRARAGTIRSPIWRSGGKAFAAKPRDYSQKVNKKMYRGALCSIFSQLVDQKRLIIVDQFEIEEPKTKLMIKKLDVLNFKKGLIISEDVSENLYLSVRNIPNIYVRDVEAIDPVSLLNSDKIVITVAALKKVEEMLV